MFNKIKRKEKREHYLKNIEKLKTSFFVIKKNSEKGIESL